MNKWLKAITFCFGIIFFGFFFTSDVFAGIAVGGDSPGLGSVVYDCNGPYNCPKWMMVSKFVYNRLLDWGRIQGSYTGLNDCRNDDYVIVSAYVRADTGELYIRNFNTNSVIPLKKNHTYLGKVLEWGNVQSFVNWVGYEDSTRYTPTWYFFNETAGVYDGKSITYGRLLQLAMQESGKSERDIAAFCMSSVQQNRTLTVKLIDTTGRSLGNDIVVTVNSGSKASATVGQVAGYTKTKWGTSTASNTWTNDTGMTYTVNSLTSDTTVYAVYERNQFVGQITVKGGGQEKSTEYDDSAETVNGGTLSFDCVNANGCDVTFTFDLKLVSGSGATPWGIKDQKGTSVKVSSTSPTSSGTNVYTIPVSIKPGNTVCYTFYYDKFGGSSNTRTKKICAKVNPSTFMGRVDITGGDPKTIDWSNTNQRVSAEIKNCSAVSGCNVSFSHSLKRSSGVAETSYTVSRTFNFTATTKSITPNTGVVKSGNTSIGTDTKNNNKAQSISSTSNQKLYPGMVVCEVLSFVPGNNATENNSEVKLTACASALGDSQPPDPSTDPPEPPNGKPDPGNSAFLNIKVKNGNSDYKREVYAKPSDTVTFRAVYNPILQYTYNLIPQKIKIDNGATYPSSNAVNISLTLGALFNQRKASNLKNWNNAFTVFSTDMSPGYAKNYNYNAGNSELRSVTNDYGVTMSDVGKSLSETAQTNRNDNTKTTVGQVSFISTNQANVSTASRSSTAYVRVPYNFTASSKITSDLSGTFAAGENVNVGAVVTVNPKTNTLTSRNRAYATTIANPIAKLIVYSGDERAGTSSWGSGANDNLCSYYGFNNGQDACSYTSNKLTGNIVVGQTAMWDTSTQQVSTSFNVRDLRAGSKVCVAIANYPSTSGADGNYNDAGGNHRWYISDSKCFTVAKKPSIQVWGGNVYYSNGTITTSTATKNNLAGIPGYSVENSSSTNYVFGSWAELGIIPTDSLSAVSGFTSGAGLGYAENINGVLWPNLHPANGVGNNSSVNGRSPGGGREINLCRRSTLTFANFNCSGVSTISNINNNNTLNSKDVLFGKYYLKEIAPNTSGTVGLNDESKRLADGVYYYTSASELTVPATTVNKGTIQIVYTKENINIDGNINYDLADGYRTLSDVPKLVLVAEKNVVINCAVNNIDALIIASGNVKTCNSDDINSEANSNQLVVHGSIVSGSFRPNRTYGAATGANSMVPAEIIDYDSTLYLWGGSNDGNDNDGNGSDGAGGSDVDLKTSFIREISPRY